MDPIIGFLVWLIIVVVLLGALWWALTELLPLPAKIRTAIVILVALILLLYVATRFGLLAGL